MKVKPAEGLKIRDPQSKKFIPESGKEVPETTYWVRRVACGDVIVVNEVQLDVPEESEQ